MPYPTILPLPPAPSKNCLYFQPPPPEPRIDTEVLLDRISTNVYPASLFMITDQPPPLLPLPFAIHESHSRISRDTLQSLTRLLENRIHNSTVPFF